MRAPQIKQGKKYIFHLKTTE